MTRSDLALAALATAAVPGMQPVSVVGVRPSHARARYRTAVVEDATGRRWLVRAPRDRASGAELERNDGLVRLLGRHLPFKVPAAAGYADSKDGRVAVYPFVEGRPLRLRSLPAGPGLAAAVGRAVAAVHNIPRELFEEAGAPVFDAAGYRSRLLAELDRAAETGHVPTGLLARWEEALEAAPLWQFATTPTHGALDGSSFLVAFTADDAASGRVVALTGWERAQVADPADDFAILVHQASGPGLEAVLDSYALARSQRPDPHLVTRARLAAEMRLVHGLATAVWAEDEDEVSYRADQLRKLDRLTSVDDSLVPRTVRAAGAAPFDAETEPAAQAQGGPEPSAAGGEPPTGGDGAQDLPEAPVPGEQDTTADAETAAAGSPAAGSPAAGDETADESLAAAPAEPEGTGSEPDITTEIPVMRPAEEPAERLPGAAAAAEESDPEREEQTGTADRAESPAEARWAHPSSGLPDEDPDERAWEVSPPEPDPTTSPEAPDEEATDEEATGEEVEERLHTLYGMPVAEEADVEQPAPEPADAGDPRGADSEGADGTGPGRGGAAS